MWSIDKKFWQSKLNLTTFFTGKINVYWVGWGGVEMGVYMGGMVVGGGRQNMINK